MYEHGEQGGMILTLSTKHTRSAPEQQPTHLHQISLGGSEQLDVPAEDKGRLTVIVATLQTNPANTKVM
jgi:hypothetical protein